MFGTCLDHFAARATWMWSLRPELRADLTADLREGGRTVPKRTREKTQPPPRPAGARKLSRLAGEEPEGLLDEAVVRRAALRKRKAEEAELAFEESAGDQRRSRRLGGLSTQQAMDL